MDNIFILPDSGYTFICSTIFPRRFVGHSMGVKRKRVPVVTMCTSCWILFSIPDMCQFCLPRARLRETTIGFWAI